MTVGRTCSECGASLAGRSPATRTCSNACRLKRSRRERRANRDVQEFAERNNAGAAEVAAIVRREAPDVITRVMKENLEPVVREAITEDVLRAIQKMLGLTPRAVECLQEDLESDDVTVRHRAASLIVKYTVGHPALVKPADTEAGGQLVVNFGLPRPDTAVETTIADEATIVDTRVCDVCGEDKPESEFEGNAPRCSACFAAWREQLLKEFA